MSYFTNFTNTVFSAGAFVVNQVSESAFRALFQTSDTPVGLNPPVVPVPSGQPVENAVPATDVVAVVGAVAATVAFAVAAYYAVRHCRRDNTPEAVERRTNEQAQAVFLLNNPDADVAMVQAQVPAEAVAVVVQH